ncbi:MAG TPA: DUF5107 domain-containing protein [Candidatus Limiplasma sp.]|nr:DUF5107 domain-containing protein [Candidatus Limiplasma sp.]HPS81426.1 DUF5107 domain-containing protein [Candidatus Limiplasma sp.]
MQHIPGQAEVWEETLSIPTYGVGEPDPNPMFLEKRVYQGSSGKVYPLPVIDTLSDEKKDQPYQAVWLENDYLRILVLPELGGRIQRAYDKTNGYDFVYYNEVIKPALVGLAGPWISGGIEFNWPQHHRPTTYSPVEHTLRSNPDGSKSVLLSEVDPMYGTKGMMTFTLYPDRAYLEIQGRLYNRTPLPQTFLWWANPAVAVNDHTQSIFPPDVHAVMDHGKRDVSRFPIATGVYYKHDYGAGVDISRYKNVPVPTSYMAYHSDFDFVGGYDEGAQAGVLHIADHHISPGKKQWTWGSGDFGQAWDRNLTDRNGPYIELMTGMFTDNQPDFSWLKPFEEKTFTQVFMPYKKIGRVCNANTSVVLGLEVAGGGADVRVYATAPLNAARVTLLCDGEPVWERVCDLSPVSLLLERVPVPDCEPDRITLAVMDAQGRELLSYTPAKPEVKPLPAPAEPLPEPERIPTVEELALAATHLEQYRHATFDPDPYYLEGLRRDPGDIRCNTGYGMLLLRRGLFEQAEAHFRAAVRRATWKNPNPYDSEPYVGLGLSLYYQRRMGEAYDAFYKATWTAAQQEIGFAYLSILSAAQGRFVDALAHVEKALVRNAHNLKARAIKAVMLRKLGRTDEAQACCRETLALDPFANLCALELNREAGALTLGRKPERFIEAAIDYLQIGCAAEAVDTLRLAPVADPMLDYYEAYALAQCNGDATQALRRAAAGNPRRVFPNRLEDIFVLRYSLAQNPDDALAAYALGNLFYDRKRYGEAGALWQQAAALLPTFATVRRNLALYYFNKAHEPDQALAALQEAYRLNPDDARVLLELDQLYRKLGSTPEQRIQRLQPHLDIVCKRDDLTTEYITLLNLLGRYEEARSMTLNRHFHPWEGGEGKITAQYALSLKQLARRALANGEPTQAEALLTQALTFPDNLGEDKLEGARDNDIYYLLGLAARQLGNHARAVECFETASIGNEEPAGMMFYNDQPADMILYQGLAHRALGREQQALTRFHKLVDYGERHLFDDVKIDYFAVSLPDMQLFDDDLNARNRAHCQYLIALGSYGLGDASRARAACAETLKIDPAHLGATVHAPIFEQG